MGDIHNLKLAKLHRVNRRLQDGDLGALLDDLQVCEDFVNDDRSEDDAREACGRLVKNLRVILDELEPE